MKIYCKRCGYTQFLNEDQTEMYNVWSEHKRTLYPFTCEECGEVLLTEQDWEKY